MGSDKAEENSLLSKIIRFLDKGVLKFPSEPECLDEHDQDSEYYGNNSQEEWGKPLMHAVDLDKKTGNSRKKWKNRP